jgi:hypothetical protein
MAKIKNAIKSVGIPEGKGSLKAGLHGASREARQVNEYLAPSYLLRVDINLPKF